MARKPSALARELLRNFPKGRRGRRRRRKSGDKKAPEAEKATAVSTNGASADEKDESDGVDDSGAAEAADAAAEIERAAAELNGARSTEDEVADLFAEQQELGEGDLEGYSVDE